MQRLLLGVAAAAALLFPIGGGAWLLAGQLRAVFEGWQSRGWPSAPAVVRRSDAVPMGPRPNASTSTGRGYIAIELRYTFDVAGRSYEGHRRSLDLVDKLHADEGARRLVEKAPVGSAVTAYYDPVDPTRSLLEPGVPLGAVIASLIGVVMVAGGTFAAYAVWRGLARTRARARPRPRVPMPY